MEKVAINQLQPGMLIAETILGENGKALIIEGTSLTENLIKRLADMEKEFTYVYHEQTIEADPGEVLETRVLIHARNLLSEYLPTDLYKKSNERAFQRFDIVSNMLKKIVNNPRIASFFLDLRAIDEYTMEHSIHVCVISLLVGTGLNMNEELLETLGTGALLHDVGRIQLPKELRGKVGGFSGEVELQFLEHTKYGYQLLRDQGLSPEVARIALYHHEKWDGSGPNRLAGDKVDLLSRIVAVCNVYDEYVGSIASQRYLPHEAIEYLYGTGDYYYDARVVKAFTSSVCIYPLGSVVKLNTGEIGVVVNVDKNIAPRPIVKLCYDRNNEKIKYPQQIDLSTETTLFISSILW